MINAYDIAYADRGFCIELWCVVEKLDFEEVLVDDIGTLCLLGLFINGRQTV